MFGQTLDRFSSTIAEGVYPDWKLVLWCGFLPVAKNKLWIVGCETWTLGSLEAARRQPFHCSITIKKICLHFPL